MGYLYLELANVFNNNYLIPFALIQIPQIRPLRTIQGLAKYSLFDNNVESIRNTELALLSSFL